MEKLTNSKTNIKELIFLGQIPGLFDSKIAIF